MRIVYVGMSRAPVEIVEAGITVDPGVPVDVPAAIARRLLEQSDVWRKPTVTKE